ncbi:MAG TPA: AI-2E family transporter [Gemmatimonadaceae bacterium]|nr:AI-2E family transporter [Gemmatimonadaceae bacterium]
MTNPENLTAGSGTIVNVDGKVVGADGRIVAADGKTVAPDAHVAKLPQPTGKYRAASILILLGTGILWAMLPFAPGIFGAAIFYVLAVPGYRWLLKKRVSRTVAATIMLLLVLVIILVPGSTLVTVLIEEIPAAIRGLDTGPLVQKVQGLRVGPINVGEQLARASGSIGSWASAQVLGAVGGAARSTLNLVIAMLGLYYLLIAAEDVWPRVKRYLPFTDEDSEEMRVKFYEVTMATVLGVVVVAVIQGVLVGVAFAVLGLPNPIVWGTVTAIASVLPLVGSALVWLPATVVLFATGHPGKAIGLAIFGFVVVSNLDNVMRPLVSKKVGNLHPLTTLLGAFAGIEYIGLIGVLLGPLAITWFFELLVIYDKEYGLTDRYNLMTKS